MKRHDIRLRKQEFSANRIRQYKDYKQLMRKHHRTNRTKTILQFTVAVVLLVFVTGLVYFSASGRFVPRKSVEGPDIKVETNIPGDENGADKFEDQVVTVVGRAATPVGGLERYGEYLRKNLRYPAAARQANMAGTVLVQFLVGPDGSLGEFRILRSVGGGCDEEAIRLIKEGPEWMPGLEDGEPEGGGMIVPVTFEPKGRN